MLRRSSRYTQSAAGTSGSSKGAKTQIEEAKEKLSELRSPEDQLQQKLNRERKLKAKAEKLKESIKEEMLVVAEAGDRLEAYRDQLHETIDELERIKSQKILLATANGAPVAPMDIATCISTMQGGFSEMFNDPRLSDQQRAQKAELEAGFLQMRNFASVLSGIQAMYETAKLQAAVTTATAAAELPAAASELPSQTASEAEGGAPVATEEATTPPAAVGGGAPGAPAAVVPVPDGPPEERSANRDRTPPPNKGTRKKKDFDKMSEAELAGPRKAKGSSSKTAA